MFFLTSRPPSPLYLYTEDKVKPLPFWPHFYQCFPYNAAGLQIHSLHQPCFLFKHPLFLICIADSVHSVTISPDLCKYEAGIILVAVIVCCVEAQAMKMVEYGVI